MTAGVEIWLYGSRARGDADPLSDTDVLAIGDLDADIESAVAGLDYPRINVSVYTWDELERMWAYGSLYLHHLAQEGRPLVPGGGGRSRLSAILADVPPFTRAVADLAGFRRALAESRSSLATGGWPDFECEVVATVARHAAILGAYCVGQPAFGRESPFSVVGAALGYTHDQIQALARPATAWRLHLAGSHTKPAAMESWFSRVERFLRDLQQVIDDYEAVLPSAS